MADHYCPHEQDFGIMKTKINALNKVIFDNGTPGLQTTVIKINSNLENRDKLDINRKESDKELKDAVQDLRTVVSGFETFQKENEIKKKVVKTIEHEREQTKRFRIGLAITSLFAFASVFIAYLSYLKT